MTERILFFIADTASLEDSEKFSEGLTLVTDERREQIGRFRFRKDKNLSLGAGLLLKRACAEFGIPGAEAELTAGAHGKPAFSGHSEVFFNLSHSGSMVLCSIGSAENGCDVEIHQDRILGYTDRLLTQGELEDFRREAGTEEEKRFHFFRLWTGKESLMKCTGKGIALGLKSFSLRVDALGMRLEEPIDEHDYLFFEYFGEAGYGITLCLRDYEGPAPELIKVNL